MTKNADAYNEYLHVLRVLMLSFLKGSAPMIAIEMDGAHSRPCPAQLRRDGKALQGPRCRR